MNDRIHRRHQQIPLAELEDMILVSFIKGGIIELHDDTYLVAFELVGETRAGEKRELRFALEAEDLGDLFDVAAAATAAIRQRRGEEHPLDGPAT